MLTGRAVFEGETVGEILGGVFRAEPDWSRLPAETPEGIRRLLRRCLHKDSNLRIRDIRDARIEIDESKGEPQVNSPVVHRASHSRERLAWISALLGLALIAGVVALRRAPGPPVKPAQFVVLPPPKANFTPDISSQAISPDGRQLVFAAAAADGVPMLWVRPLDSLTTRVLAGTEDSSIPFWSPDSRSIGFFARGKLKRIEVAGGSPQTLADASFGLGGSWSRDGVILYSPNLASPLLQIPAGGGTAKPATNKDEKRRDLIHMGASFLPDGRHFLFWAGPIDAGVYVGSLDTNEVSLVLRTDSAATYAPPGYLLFLREGTLMAQRFDAARMLTTGDPMPVVEQVGRFISQAGFSVSDDGVLVFRAADAGQTELVWVDRAGRRIDVVAPLGSYINVALSPDENRVAFDRETGAAPDVWLMDLRRHITERFTFQPGVDNVPVWSADGRIVAFASQRGRGLDIYQRSTDASGPEDVLLKLDAAPIMFPSDWSSDGRYLTYYRTDAKTLNDIWALPLFGDRKPFPVLQGEFNESQSQFSPDVKWIAYVSDESGTPQIYVQSFPTLNGKLQISTDGGMQPRWRRDGRELFYLAPNRKLMAVTIKAAAPFQAETPRPLFETRLDGTALRHTYAVSADGNRFLLNVAPESGAPPLTIVVNWPALLKK